MAKVIFSVQYEINPNKREDYLTVVRELKNLLKAEGLESYNVYEVKSKANHFQELFTFSSMEAYEQFEDDQNLYIHCAGGYRSVIAASMMKKEGIHNLRNVLGGWNSIKMNEKAAIVRETEQLN